ncbi:MAG: hypothetical protein LUQ67_00520, partial [Methanomicrobiales archaeon]|nr:hypothetical protein [Methanomicrobiales archaeon]
MKKRAGGPGIAEKRAPILIEGARHRGRTVDAFIDAEGKIAALGRDAGKKARRDAETRIDARRLLLIPGLV